MMLENDFCHYGYKFFVAISYHETALNDVFGFYFYYPMEISNY